MKSIKSILLITILIIFSCQEENSNTSTDRLNEIITNYQDHEGYDREEFPLGLYTTEYYQSQAEYAQSVLEDLTAVTLDDLSETDQISYELLKFVLQDEIDYFETGRYLNPILADAGFHSSLTYRVRPLANYKQVIGYLNMINAIPTFVDQHFEILRESLEKGVSQPRVIFNGYESTYDDHIVDNYEDSFYYSPFKSLPNDLTEQQKDSVLTAAKAAIENSVTPQFKRIKAFFETEYFPKTRTSLGASDMPNGDAYYQNRINFYTTSTQYSANDIHQIGLK